MLNNKEKMKAEKLKFTIIQNKNKFKKILRVSIIHLLSGKLKI